jgi:mono/diheme cytochrome c family protein
VLLRTHLKVVPLFVAMLVALFLLNACTDSETSSNTKPSNATLESGRVLYSANCQACHGDQQGIGRLGLVPSHGPDGHTWHHPDGQLLEIFLDGTTVIREISGLPPSDVEMPSFRDRLTQEEALAILSYTRHGGWKSRGTPRQQSPGNGMRPISPKGLD